MAPHKIIVPDWFPGWFDATFPPSRPVLHEYAVAKRLGVDKNTVMAAIRRGDLPATERRRRRGKVDRLVKRDDVRAWCLASLEINRNDYDD